MSRFIKPSVAVLLTIGGTGIAFANSTNNYNLYEIPSSGSLGLAPISTDIASASFGFNPMPDAGFGPSTASLENSDSISAAVQPRAALKFKDRWLFDYGTGAPPRRRQNHAQRGHRAQSLWALMGL